MWNDLILGHEGPSEIRDTKIAALRLKFNAFKALEGEKESDSDVEEDTRSSKEFLADLNLEFHDRALLAKQKRFYKRSGRVGATRKPMEKSDETCFACESLYSKDEGTTTLKAFMAIAEDEPVVGKTNARSERGDGVAGFKRRRRDLSSDGVMDLTTVSGHPFNVASFDGCAR
ncbi:hypothetical protein Tco_0755185 [Tanacetum coccineum]